MGRRLVKGSSLKTAFRTRNGPLKYQTMRLPATFQRYVNKTLVEKLD